jgi:hypothetical protein
MRVTGRVFAVLALFVAACGDQAACEFPSGTYSEKLTLRDGCGPPSNQLTKTFDGNELKVAPNCSGTAVASGDHCTSTVDVTCPGTPGSHTTTKGTITWNADGTSGQGVWNVAQVDDSSNAVTCNGNYDVTFSKQ